MDTLRLYLRYVGISVRAQMQHRASFWMLAISQFLVTGTEFMAVWAMFDRFGTLRGWTLPEVALLYGLINVAFSLAEGAGRGFDVFADQVRSGDFDRLLLRPRGTAFQVAAQEWQLGRIGRLTQGLLVLLWSAAALDVVWTPARAGLAAGAVLGGACTFYGLFILQATLAFWSVQSLEVMNTVTYGGVETGSFPLSIYQPWLRRVFTYLVPLACANYFPAHALLDRTDPLGSSPLFQWLSPWVGLLFLGLSLRIWGIGVRHYRSTGS